MPKRPKGRIVEWRPRGPRRARLARIREVLIEYAELLPLTVRQVFYRLVGLNVIEKTDDAYDRIGEDLTLARRAGEVPWEAIRDDGILEIRSPGFVSAASFYEDLKGREFRLHPRLDQPVRIEVWAEAAGMVDQLARVAHPFGATVVGLGGQPSVTTLHDAAVRTASRPVPTVVLSIGDHDRQGLIIWDTILADVPFLADGSDRVTFERVAVTREQIDELDLPLDPGRSDFTRDGVLLPAVEAEAIAPDVLAAILTDALERHVDLDVLDDLNARSAQVERRVRTRLARLAREGSTDDED